MAKARSKTSAGKSSVGRAGSGAGAQAGRLRPPTRSLRDVLAERGPLTGPVTDAGTKALMAMRGDEYDGGHGGR
jgi:hypothetical protein